MSKLIVSLFLIGMVFVSVILGTLVGAFCGWFVGLFFEETILGIFACIGIKGFTMWQIGAFLGFVGGFFRSSVTNNIQD